MKLKIEEEIIHSFYSVAEICFSKMLLKGFYYESSVDYCGAKHIMKYNAVMIKRLTKTFLRSLSYYV